MKKGLIVFVGIVILGAGVVFFMQRTTSVILEVRPGPVVAPTSESRSYSMLFAGDIMLDRSVRKQIERAQDPLYPFARIADTVRAADLSFANLEGPVSERGTNQGSIYSFRFEPVGTLNALTSTGFDVVNLANNHIWDWGVDALTDTLVHLDGAGIGHIGAGKNAAEANKPFIATLDDTKIAFLGYTTLYPKSLQATTERPGISSFDISSTSAAIQELKASGAADLVVISFHWGTEYEERSTSTQQMIARELIDAGADLIIGHHPHVVQEIEKYTSASLSTGKGHTGWIVYSLGNFVFDQNLSRITMKGLMVEATVQDKKIESIKEIPIQLTPTFQPYIPGLPGDPELDVVE